MSLKANFEKQDRANPLRTLVISMGFLLVGGTILLMVVVFKKVSADTAKMRAGQECAGGKIDLKGRGSITNTLIDGKIMRITLEKKPGLIETVSVEFCTGKILGSLAVESDK